MFFVWTHPISFWPKSTHFRNPNILWKCRSVLTHTLRLLLFVFIISVTAIHILSINIFFTLIFMDSFQLLFFSFFSINFNPKTGIWNSTIIRCTGETSALGYKASTSVTNKQSNSREENGMSKRRLEKLSSDPELNTSSRHSGGPRLHAGASTTSARSVDSSPSCLITFGGAPRPQNAGIWRPDSKP